jgi:hypothetical protein
MTLERFIVVKGSTTLPDLPTDELLNLSRTLPARLATFKERQGRAAQPAPTAAGSDAFAGAVKTSCNPVVADIQHTFFNG